MFVIAPDRPPSSSLDGVGESTAPTTTVEQATVAPLHENAAGDDDVECGGLTISQFLSQRGLKGGVDLEATGHGFSTSDSVVADEAGRRYDRGEVIAKGGMGAILEAKDLNIRRRVAMKVMLHPKQADLGQLLRFIEEAQVTGQLEHPSIVPVHELGLDAAGHVFYTMKYVNGKTLKAIIADIRSGDPETLSKYSLPHLLTIFLKVCDALAFAHRKGVIHRDLKPENVMVGEFGEVLVMDWGLAKVLLGGSRQSHPATSTSDPRSTPDTDPPAPVTQTSGIESVRCHVSTTDDNDRLYTLDGQIMGTPNFMAPEQAQGKINQLDARTDLYSLGAILYTILTLRPPVSGQTLAQILTNVVQGKITPPTHYNRTKTRQQKRLSEDHAVLHDQQVSPAELGRTDSRPLAHIPGGIIPQALSAIAMKALSPTQDARYQSVNDLQQDIERFQGGFATVAEDASLSRQLALLVRRHRGFVSAIALLAATLTVGMFVSLMQRHSAIVARQAAEASERRAVAARATTEEALRAAGVENYCNSIAMADARIRDGTIPAAEQALWKAPPTLRHWEWGYLLQRCQPLNPVVSGSPRPEVALSPSGKQVVHTTHNWRLAVRDVATGNIAVSLAGPGMEVKDLAWSPDGRCVASVSASRNMPLRLWNPVTGKEFGRIVDGAQPLVTCVAFSPDSRRVAAGDQNGVVRIYTVENGIEELRVEAPFEHGLRSCVSLCFSPDGTKLLTGHQGIGAILWNGVTGEEIRQYRIFRAGNRVAFSPDGRHIAIGYQEIQLLDLEDGQPLAVLRGHESSVFGLAFTADGRSLVSASMDRTLRVWNIANEQEQIRFVGHQGAVRSLALHSPSGLAVSGGSDGMLNFWDIRNPAEPLTLDGASPSGGFAFSPDARKIVGTGYRGQVTVHDTETGKRILDFKGHDRAGRVAAFAPDGRWFVTAGGDDTAKVWEARNGSERAVLRGHDGGILSVAVAPDGSRILTCGEDKTVRIWEANSGKQLLLSTDQPNPKTCRFSPDGKSFAVGYISQTATTWNSGDGTPRQQMSGPKDAICVRYSPDGGRLAVGYTDFTARVFDSETGEEQLCLRSHGEWVTDLTFSPDGKRLATVSRDRSLKIWDAESGRELLSIPCHDATYSLDGSSDGLLLVTGGQVFRAFDWKTATPDATEMWRENRWRHWVSGHFGQ
jgi:WD40 repeat protein/serine/threonine protein kinase